MGKPFHINRLWKEYGQSLRSKWSAIATEEYENDIDWLLLNWNEKIAFSFVHTVTQKIKLLQTSPHLGGVSEYLPDCRKTLILPYHILLYKVADEHIEIIRLFDGRQDTEKLKTP